MTTKDHDTDPSTPSARRPAKARGSTSPPPPPVGTDPGLAPPPHRSEPPSSPLGIRVPAPSVRPPPAGAVPAQAHSGTLGEMHAALKSKKDSVELLLEGMAELRLERSRTTPQTDGQASASYHAEHAVRAAERPPPLDEAKVLFERPSTPLTLRLARPAVAAPPETALAEATLITPSYTLRRVVLALCAGVAVVIGIFLALQIAIPTLAPGPSATVPVAAAPTPPPSPIGTTRTVLPSAAAGADLSVPAMPATAASSPLPAGDAAPGARDPATARGEGGRATPAAPPTTRRRPKLAPQVPAGDLGEFKTSY